MSGLGRGLKRDEGDRQRDAQAEDFIHGARQRVNLKPPKRRVYKTYTFSLTEAVSADIDRLSCAPSDFRSSRSDVVKAAIHRLLELPKDQLVDLLRQVK